ncbi:hypothetical protein [Flavobacterium akiainvivens]|uniref:hypothetical protein n=1 Tax=Flavobacterium akiainvivens TaxID=1202724 RepID=UPI0006C85106|nr:hypothetical protein [Flavobacterium akiainvivens]SFQ66355.1 hypothetical protein SAMN05444144_11322 [Flavobacterium akiainvivens]
MTFDYQGYPLEFLQKQPCKDKSAHLFTLLYKFYSPVTHYHYILRAEYHEFDVFAIKFYCVKDKHSEYKYSKIVNKGDIGNILITCALAVPMLLIDYPTASFAFAGARSIDFKSRKVENYQKNQRFRIYSNIVAKKFGNKTFAHYEYEDISAYLLVNKSAANIDEKEREIVAMFAANYDNLPDV